MAVFIWDNQDSLEFSEGVKLSGIEAREVSAEKVLLEQLAPEDLVIMNQTLNDRKYAVRQLIAQRIPFAIYGMPGPDEEARMQLAHRLKKRHVQACWLGSLRFLAGMFRLKELVNSGVFGRLAEVKIGGVREEDCTFDFFRRGDLLEWLLSGTEMNPEVCWIPARDGEYAVSLRGNAGEARWSCSRLAGAELVWRMGNKEKKAREDYGNPLATELQLLYTIFVNHRPWNGIARIKP